MNIPKDFREFLELLNDSSVDYVVVGGYALAFHGAPRFTGDIDILETAAAGAVRAEIDGTTLPIIGRDALILNKRASGRRKDLADLEALGEQ